MKKDADFSIHFDPPRAVFYPGRPIKGYVRLDLKDPMKIRGISIKLSGKIYVSWKGQVEHDGITRIETFTQKEVIINTCECVFGSLPGSGSRNYIHPAGKTSYSFSIGLPNNLPSSFEGKFGYIRYILKAKIHKPWKFDRKTKCPVTIHEFIDTNHPMYSSGERGEAHLEIPVSCFSGGTFDMNVNIDRSCYYPGETILINADIMNNCRQNMHKLKAKLIQYVTYSTPTGNKTVLRDVIVLNGPPIRKRQHERWLNQPMNIPTSIPPTNSSSKLISVTYKVKIKAGKPKGDHAVVEMNILIGTVPYYGHLRQSIENFMVQSQTAKYFPLLIYQAGRYDDHMTSSSNSLYPHKVPFYM